MVVTFGIFFMYISVNSVYIVAIFFHHAVLQKQVVKYKGHEVHNLNELEYVNDEVWANVWQVPTQ